MKERTDKLDAIVLASSITGFHVDVIEGVRGSDISNKTLPVQGVPKVRFFLLILAKLIGIQKEEWYEKRFDNIAGCWRSHLNFAHRYTFIGYTQKLH